MRRVETEEARKAGKATGFVQRATKLGGAELAQTAATIGVAISAQGLDQRYNPEGAACLKKVLDAAVSQLVQGEGPALAILQRSRAVYVQDSSVVELPEALAEEWRGCGNASGKGRAAVKIEVRFDLLSGEMIGPLLEDTRVHDAVSHIQTEPMPAGALRIADLG